jgi:hypothetical protein
MGVGGPWKLTESGFDRITQVPLSKYTQTREEQEGGRVKSTGDDHEWKLDQKKDLLRVRQA